MAGELDSLKTWIPRQRLLRILVLFGVVAVLWTTGLFWFAATLETEPEISDRRTDAIVVLTGGSLRVEQGIKLLSRGLADKLFVSGVAQGVDVKKLLKISREAPEHLSCCIALGYEADDTAGNARETADWMQAQGYASLRLVTAAYHMPRSLLEFRRTMPEVEILPHPVFPAHVKQEDWWRWPGSTNLLVSEYSKFLIARLRAFVVPIAK
jgi:uncharacterized SAM-binding protein YcdF (DUF218 family)